MQTCFYTQLPYLMDNAATSANQTYDEDLLDFTTGECQSTDTHLVTHEVSDLNLSLQLNRQLHATLRRKQEEISTLEETNAQLRNLAKQTEHYATILDALTTSLQADSQYPAVSPTEDESSEHSWISLLTQEEPSDPSSAALTSSTTTDTQSPTSGLKRDLWSTLNDLLCDDAEDLNCPSGSKRLRLDNKLEQELEHLKAQLVQDEPQASQELKEDSTPDQNLEMSSEGQRVNIFGAFRGFRVVKEFKSEPNTSGDDGKVVCFKTSIRDHSTVKTKVFPHGKAFTSHTQTGSCRFLWVPKEH